MSGSASTHTKVTIGGETGEPTPAPADQSTEGTPPQTPDLTGVPEGVDPASIPAKYHRGDGTVDWTAMIAQHNHLEADRGTPAPTDTPTGTPPPEKGGGDVEAMTPEAAYPFLQEFQKTGQLSPTSYKVLESQYGYTAPQVDNFIRAQADREKVYYTAVADSVGGRESWEEIVKWADRALTQDRSDWYGRQIHGGDQGAAMNAARALQAEFQAAAGGVQGTLLQGDPSLPSGETVKPFPSVAAKDAALRKKGDKGELLYNTDPEYRQMVDSRHMAMHRAAQRR